MPKRPPLQTAAAAEYLGITVRHLREMVARREIPFHKAGRLNMFDPDDLDAHTARTRVEATG